MKAHNLQDQDAKIPARKTEWIGGYRFLAARCVDLVNAATHGKWPTVHSHVAGKDNARNGPSLSSAWASAQPTGPGKNDTEELTYLTLKPMTTPTLQELDNTSSAVVTGKISANPQLDSSENDGSVTPYNVVRSSGPDPSASPAPSGQTAAVTTPLHPPPSPPSPPSLPSIAPTLTTPSPPPPLVLSPPALTSDTTSSLYPAFSDTSAAIDIGIATTFCTTPAISDAERAALKKGFKSKKQTSSASRNKPVPKPPPAAATAATDGPASLRHHTFNPEDVEVHDAVVFGEPDEYAALTDACLGLEQLADMAELFDVPTTYTRLINEALVVADDIHVALLQPKPFVTTKCDSSTVPMLKLKFRTPLYVVRTKLRKVLEALRSLEASDSGITETGTEPLDAGHPDLKPPSTREAMLAQAKAEAEATEEWSDDEIVPADSTTWRQPPSTSTLPAKQEPRAKSWLKTPAQVAAEQKAAAAKAAKESEPQASSLASAGKPSKTVGGEVPKVPAVVAPAPSKSDSEESEDEDEDDPLSQRQYVLTHAENHRRITVPSERDMKLIKRGNFVFAQVGQTQAGWGEVAMDFTWQHGTPLTELFKMRVRLYPVSGDLPEPFPGNSVNVAKPYTSVQLHQVVKVSKKLPSVRVVGKTSDGFDTVAMMDIASAAIYKDMRSKMELLQAQVDAAAQRFSDASKFVSASEVEQMVFDAVTVVTEATDRKLAALVTEVDQKDARIAELTNRLAAAEATLESSVAAVESLSETVRLLTHKVGGIVECVGEEVEEQKAMLSTFVEQLDALELKVGGAGTPAPAGSSDVAGVRMIAEHACSNTERLALRLDNLEAQVDLLNERPHLVDIDKRPPPEPETSPVDPAVPVALAVNASAAAARVESDNLAPPELQTAPAPAARQGRRRDKTSSVVPGPPVQPPSEQEGGGGTAPPPPPMPFRSDAGLPPQSRASLPRAAATERGPRAVTTTPPMQRSERATADQPDKDPAASRRGRSRRRRSPPGYNSAQDGPGVGTPATAEPPNPRAATAPRPVFGRGGGGRATYRPGPASAIVYSTAHLPEAPLEQDRPPAALRTGGQTRTRPVLAQAEPPAPARLGSAAFHTRLLALAARQA